jgi:hypothetical protein
MKKKPDWKGASFQTDTEGRIARRVFNIKIKPLEVHCNEYYYLELYQDNEIDTNGLLLVGKLKPKISTLAEFWFRWDEKKDQLDIDIYDDSKCKIDWKYSGYEGHHTVRTKKDEKYFKVFIKRHNLQIFKGEISFNLARVLNIQGTVGILDRMTIVKNPPNKKTP